jgi:hypothetical protein
MIRIGAGERKGGIMSVTRVWIGSILVVVGGLFLLEAVDVLDAGETIGTWWPLALIGAGVLELLMGHPRHWVGPSVLMAIGGLILLRTTETITDFGPAVWAVILIILGLGVLTRSLFRQGTTLDVDRVSSFVMFGGRELASHSQRFAGGTVGSVFGGTELDLRDAALAPGASLEVFSAFGGTEISVPHGWRVDMQGFPLFGGFENTTAKETDLGPEAPVLTVQGTALFGGIEVKH